MKHKKAFSTPSVVAITLAALIAIGLVVLRPIVGQDSRVLITEPIDDSRLITLLGNTRPEARNLQNDRGRVPDDFPMNHMFLQLRRAPESELALKQYMDQQQDKTSPNFRHWLMPAELGQKYGVVDSDIETIKAWLLSHGFTVGYVYPTHMVMDISGTAGQIREAFHTEIHNLDVNGELHFANMSDPQIPVALAPAVVGLVQLHNFKPHHMAMPRQKNYTLGGGEYPLVPADWQTIYNLSPLYRGGLYGQGQTIVVVEDTNSYGSDFSTFQTTFGLNNYGGTLTTVHPDINGNCTNPGTNGDDGEADLDVEMVAAMAPGAIVELASCTTGTPTTTNFGGLIAIENLVSAGTPPAVISMSYGECEVITGSSANAAFSNAFQSAAAAGTSVFVSSGDDGPAACSGNGSTSSSHGIGITGWGSSVYNVSVGGTDFEDEYNTLKPANGGLPQSTYWASTNGPTYGSAKSYIPEVPWNNSCGGYLYYNLQGYSAAYGSTGFCSAGGNASTGGGSGGPSGCATGTTGTTDWVSPSCAGWPKPSWQSVFGNPADGVRDIPDVSLFASNGWWGHDTVVCWSDPSQTANGSAPCTGSPSGWSGFGGTSISSPAMASIQALVNQKWHIRAGLPTPTYYSIARAEFGASGNSACYSINQPPRRGQASACVFNDITQGDIVVNCTTGGSTKRDCYKPSGDGVTSTGNITSVTKGAGGSGYNSATCAIAAPNTNTQAYVSPQGGTLLSAPTQATCTATVSGGAVTAVTLGNVGTGYTGDPVCTISGNGTGATCTAAVAVGTASPSYQPAYGATPGWDFATGLGSVNAYNLVFNSAW
jgi:hypothetical protein